MDEVEPFLTIEELLKHPPVAKADFIELSICDMVHFRMTRPESIFQLVEKRLQKRNPDRYSDFADCRLAVELSMRGATTKDKVDACCTRRPEWVDDRLILYATELEVWMDMSYANPWGLKLYHAALMEGKYISIPPLGPFTETFHELLKEKNGYELTEDPEPGYSKIQVYVGEQSILRESYLHLVTTYKEIREHPMRDHHSLGAQLVHGVTKRDLEEHSSLDTPTMEYFAHALGYRLLGPSILYLIQSAADRDEPVGISGTGSSFIINLVEDNRDFLEWLPTFTSDLEAREFVSLLPQEPGVVPLVPAIGKEGILRFSDHPHAHLIVAAAPLFVQAAFEGKDARLVQAGIRSFFRDFAQVSRGLFIPVPIEPILQHWCQCVLSPTEGFLEWAAADGNIPEFGSRTPSGSLAKKLKRSPWPSGHMQMAGNFSKWWAGLSAGKLKREILEAARSVDAESA